MASYAMRSSSSKADKSSLLPSIQRGSAICSLICEVIAAQGPKPLRKFKHQECCVKDNPDENVQAATGGCVLPHVSWQLRASPGTLRREPL